MSRQRWTITECERCSRDNTRCLLRSGEWICVRCVPEPLAPERKGQLSLGGEQPPEGRSGGPTDRIPF